MQLKKYIEKLKQEGFEDFRGVVRHGEACLKVRGKCSEYIIGSDGQVYGD